MEMFFFHLTCLMEVLVTAECVGWNSEMRIETGPRDLRLTLRNRREMNRRSTQRQCIKGEK